MLIVSVLGIDYERRRGPISMGGKSLYNCFNYRAYIQPSKKLGPPQSRYYSNRSSFCHHIPQPMCACTH